MNPAGKHLSTGVRFILGILAGFALTGVLFFTLLALWSILAGPLVRMESASFVIVVALSASVGLSIWLCHRFRRWCGSPTDC